MAADEIASPELKILLLKRFGNEERQKIWIAWQKNIL